LTEQEPRIFLCHAKEDKERVKALYRQLKKAGYHPWLDEEDLLPGVDWELEIRRAIRGSELFLACLSQKSLTRKGYIHKEIKMALDELDQMPEGKIYLIPVRLEECQVPERLRSRQWVDLFTPGGFEKLSGALDFELGKRPPQPFEPELILIPAGEFLMGSDPGRDRDAEADEQPQHRLYLPEYYIAKTPVTNAQYVAFVEATGHREPHGWQGGKAPGDKADHPVVSVSWHDAMAYCQWLAKATNKAYRLPSEAEWEKAARGVEGRIYPWGNEWDAKRCNSSEGERGGMTPVGMYSPQLHPELAEGGDSPYGCVDMAGNVWEWTGSVYEKYPYDPEGGREDPGAEALVCCVAARSTMIRGTFAARAATGATRTAGTTALGFACASRHSRSRSCPEDTVGRCERPTSSTDLTEVTDGYA
jgi:formylglycine-generating enzyme required for sulfatase activity